MGGEPRRGRDLRGPLLQGDHAELPRDACSPTGGTSRSTSPPSGKSWPEPAARSPTVSSLTLLLRREYLAEVVRPAVDEGAEKAGRKPSECNLTASALVSISDDVDLARREVKLQIAFYATTRTYTGILELHGRDHLIPELRSAFDAKDKERMIELIDDDFCDAIAMRGNRPRGERADLGMGRHRRPGVRGRAVVRPWVRPDGRELPGARRDLRERRLLSHVLIRMRGTYDPEVDEKRSRGALVEAELQEPGQPAMRTVSLTPHMKADIMRLMTFTATIEAGSPGRRPRPRRPVRRRR